MIRYLFHLLKFTVMISTCLASAIHSVGIVMNGILNGINGCFWDKWLTTHGRKFIDLDARCQVLFPFCKSGNGSNRLLWQGYRAF